MSFTNFPNGITSFGVPVMGGEGILTEGNSYFVDPIAGSDGNSGKEATQAFLTLTKAEDALITNNSDVVYLFPGSADFWNAGGTALTESLTWDKNMTRVIGVSPPSPSSQASRIVQGAANFTPLMTISGSWNHFKNIQFSYGRGNAANLVMLAITGHYNVFENCNFKGPLNGTEGGTAGYRNMTIAGQDNYFKHCTFGTDDTVITTGLSNLEFLPSAATTARPIFEDCTFVQWIDPLTGTGARQVLAATGTAFHRWAIFNRCTFIAFVSNWTAQAVGAIDSGGGTAGMVLLRDCAFLNYTDIHATGTARISSIDSIPSTGNQGLAVAVS